MIKSRRRIQNLRRCRLSAALECTFSACRSQFGLRMETDGIEALNEKVHLETESAKLLRQQAENVRRNAGLVFAALSILNREAGFGAFITQVQTIGGGFNRFILRNRFQ